MISYPRWKVALVAIVLLLGIFLALPNLFGEESALQLARDRAVVSPSDRSSVEQILKDKGVTPTGAFLDQGRLTLRFGSKQDQLKARDLISEARPTQFTIALSQASRVPEWMRNLGLNPLKLGLDLRGGVYLVYQVDVQGAVKQQLDHYEQDFRASLRNARVPYQDVLVDYPTDRVRVLFRDADSFTKGKAAILADSRNLTLTDVTVDGAPALELKLTPQQIKERQDYAVQQNIVILRNRLNSPELAVSEPQVARQGVDRIAIQLPGLQNSAEVKKILGKTATLEFRMVDENSNPLEAAATGHVPLGSKLYYTREKQPVLLKREVVVTGDQLTDASFQPNTQEGAAVSVGLDSRGAAKMLKNTQENIGHLMAVVFIDRSREKNAQGQDVDRTTEEVINRATIRGVFSNNFQITGVNPIEGRELALLLRAGGLAAPLSAVEERAIGPSLGQDNIDKGVHAMVFGMLAAFVFMAIYYKVFGLIADVVLAANVVLLTAFLSLVGAALTLPGIAAVVLTVGMAVDANILIYERIREELRNGVSPRAAITAGFDRAFSAIADSNVTALIAGLVLWLFGAGAVRGFAVVLVIGIATSMFTSLMGSRALVQVIYGGKRKVERLSI
ncbi:MAG: preprotein translocase subunit SecD [Gammaproteobacteria bacterium]|jgi:preprotein translocase subunit SecD|nr:preprotein translocase subunit SecD [Gammaproteobacteria bacterium]